MRKDVIGIANVNLLAKPRRAAGLKPIISSTRVAVGAIREAVVGLATIWTQFRRRPVAVGGLDE